MPFICESCLQLTSWCVWKYGLNPLINVCQAPPVFTLQLPNTRPMGPLLLLLCWITAPIILNNQLVQIRMSVRSCCCWTLSCDCFHLPEGSTELDLYFSAFVSFVRRRFKKKKKSLFLTFDGFDEESWSSWSSGLTAVFQLLSEMKVRGNQNCQRVQKHVFVSYVWPKKQSETVKELKKTWWTSLSNNCISVFNVAALVLICDHTV